MSEEAQNDIKRLKRSEPQAFNKVEKLLIELVLHPFTGTGHPHPLKDNRNGQWNRSITKKHRLIYRIEEQAVIVEVLSAYGHYNDR